LCILVVPPSQKEHQMPEQQDKLVAAVMERLIEEGPESMA